MYTCVCGVHTHTHGKSLEGKGVWMWICENMSVCVSREVLRRKGFKFRKGGTKMIQKWK